MKIQKLKTRTKFVFLILILLLTTASLAQAAPAYRASGTFTSGTGTITPPYPVSMVANDVCLLAVESENQAISLTTANGFVEVPTWSPQFAGTAATNPASRLALFWKRTVGGDTAPVVADSGNHQTGQIHCFSDVITSGNPWDTGAGGNDSAANDTTGTIPGSTTTVANTLVVLITSTSFNGTSTAQCSAWTNADLTSLTERTDNTNTIQLGGGHCMATGVKATAGSYATTTVTMANTTFKGAISLALQSPLMSTIYAINNSLTPNGAIMRINPANSAATIVYSGPPFVLGTQAAGLAQCPDGMLYFAEGSATGTLYRFNPNTPAVAPAVIGNTGLTNMLRMTCHPTTGVLYGMQTAPSTLYTINKSTGATSAIPLTLPGITPPATGSGDIAFDADGTLYFVDEVTAGNAATVRLWIINLATNAFENVGAVTGLPNVANGIAFDNSGNVLLSLSTQTRLYTVSADGGAAAAIGAVGAMPAAVFDLSSISVLQLTKTRDSHFISPVSFTYTVVLTAGAAVSGVVFTDPAVANLNVSNVTCAAAGGATCPASVTVAGMQGAGLTIPSMPVGGSVTFTITATVTGNPTGTLPNTATIRLSGQTNSAIDTDGLVNPVAGPGAIKKATTIRWREVY